MLLDSGYFLPPKLVDMGHLRVGDTLVSYEEVEGHSRYGPAKTNHDTAIMFFDRAQLVLDGKAQLVRPGELVIVPKGTLHTVESVDRQPTSLLRFS